MNHNISILGMPYDEQSSWKKGSAGGPHAIRSAFGCDSTNTYCESGFDIQNHPLIRDDGDLALVNGERARTSIEQAVAERLNDNRKILSLGGDHSITYPILRAYASRYPAIHVLHFDAHPDLYDQLDGNPFSHATPFARAMEDGLVGRLVQAGIRTMNHHQQQQADRFGVEVHSMRGWHEDWQFDFDGPVYLSLDLDVLDPAFAPGVSHHEPGGLSTRQLIQMIQSLDVDLVGADIVELNPARDLNSMTAMVAAKLMKEVLAKLVE